MRTIIFAGLIAVATIFTACKKDKNDIAPEQTTLPAGQYRLVEMHQADSTGVDTTGVRFVNSSLNLSFDNTARTAKLNGKAENISHRGTYTVAETNILKDAKIASSKVAGTENDMAVMNILLTAEKFERKGLAVIIYAKNKGYLKFSTQK